MSRIEFTGERFIPGGAEGEIAYEHWHRYAFGRRFAAGKRVLDAACGEGYGTALLAELAADALGVDIDAATVSHARDRYRGRPNLRYETGSVTALPLGDATVDVVLSFETIEHLPAEEQPRMLAEFSRVLAPGGLLILSSPNRCRYSDERDYRNPFHLHELYRGELDTLLGRGFPYRRWFHQTRLYASAIWTEEEQIEIRSCDAWTAGEDAIVPTTAPDGLYYIVVAACTPNALPESPVGLSLLADRNETELKRIEAQTREIFRLDRLLMDRDGAADRQMGHILHLEALVAERERIVVERDAQLVEVNAAREAHEAGLIAAHEVLAGREADLASARATTAQREAEIDVARAALKQLEQQSREQQAAIAAQERIIAYRQSLRWWLRLPLMRLHLAWRRWRGE